MTARRFPFVIAAALICAAPAAAQLGQSEGYQFLQAIRDAKGADVEKILNKPGSGSVIINTRDRTTGESALHIVAKRGDDTYMRYLLARGADANIKDNDGNTPLMTAVTAGYAGLIETLVKAGANVNLRNGSGETPLMRAVQRRDQDMVQVLLAHGADPDQTDNLQGLSARDYAHRDTRNQAIAKLIDETPKKLRRAVAGPKL